MDKRILHAFLLGGPGAGQPVAPAQLADKLAGEAPVWVHLDRTQDGVLDWLKSTLPDVDPSVPEALMQPESRPGLHVFGDGILVMLRALNNTPGQDCEDMVSLRLWIDKHRIISLQEEKVREISEIVDLCKQGHPPGTTGSFLGLLIERLNFHIEKFLRQLDATTDRVEEKVIEQPDSTSRNTIVKTRLKVITFRRFVAAQRQALTAIDGQLPAWLTRRDRHRIKAGGIALVRTVEELDEIRERLHVIAQELSDVLSERLNSHMYLLSVVAAIFLPLSFLTGLFGVNLAGIPGAAWEPAFAVFCVISVILGLLLALVFRIMKWM